MGFSHFDIPANLPSKVSLALFRVLQEALQNAVKHSHVQDFKIELRGAPGEFYLTVTDAGTGFDPVKAMGSRGMGLMYSGETAIGERINVNRVRTWIRNHHSSTCAVPCGCRIV